MKSKSRKHFSLVAVILSVILPSCGKTDEGFGFAGTTKQEKEPQVLYTNSYIVPPIFQKRFLHAYEPETTGADSSDPFAEPPPEKPPRRMTAKQIFESVGITFDEGSSVIYSAPTSQIIVRNTIEQLKLVEAYFESLLYSMETGLRIHLDVFEASSLELKALTVKHRTKENLSEALAECLEQSKKNSMKHINSSSVEMYLTEQADISSGYELSYVSGYQIKEGKPLPVLQTTNIGTNFRCIATAAADLTSIDLEIDLTHHFALPEFNEGKFPIENGSPLPYQIPVFSKGSIDTTILIIDGHTRILGTLPVPSKDPATEQKSQIIFLTAAIFFSEGAQKVFDEKKFKLQTDKTEKP